MADFRSRQVDKRPRRDRSSSQMGTEPSRKHKPDYLLLIISLLLCVVGLIVVYAISPGLAITNNVDNNFYVIKQSVAIVLGLIAFTIFALLKLEVLQYFRKILIGLAVAGVIAVEVMNDGTSRWIQIGGLSFQVAELVKLALIIGLGYFLIQRQREGLLDDTRKTLLPLMAVLLLIGIVVAFIESDLGSTAVMVAIMAAMAFVIGLPLKKIGIVAAIITVGTVLAVVSTPYRRDRVSTFLNPTSDCQDAGYQACQALIAVGSGGVIGKGLGNSVQAYGYLPEAANDSIFAVYAEKFGFIGSVIVLFLYVLLFSRLKRIIERTADGFSRLIVVGVLAWISTQAIINIGAMLGLLPLKGITLPFISYGGTSILFIMAALGIVYNISRYTNYETIRSAKIDRGNNSYDNSLLRGRVSRTYNTSAGRRT